MDAIKIEDLKELCASVKYVAFINPITKKSVEEMLKKDGIDIVLIETWMLCENSIVFINDTKMKTDILNRHSKE